MNIEIINKQLSKTLQLKESDVALVNKFFWSKIREHIYSYDNLPINIPNVCVFYPTAYHTKKQLLFYINGIRGLKVSKRYKEDSIIREKRIEEYKKNIRKIWNIRKTNKYTN